MSINAQGAGLMTKLRRRGRRVVALPARLLARLGFSGVTRNTVNDPAAERGFRQRRVNPEGVDFSLIERRKWLASLMDCNLVDLGDEIDPSFAGIFTPDGEVGKVPPGVTEQFFGDADRYYQRSDINHAEWLFRNALKNIEAPPRDPVILDVGSGPGASVIASLNILDRPSIIATDISPILLRILKSNLAHHPKGESVLSAVLDLNRPWFKREKFDLVIGAAILHHLFEPQILVSNLFQSVKPGGSLIFYEPFENGYALLSALIELIIETSNRLSGLDKDVREFLERMNMSYQTCGPKPVEKFAHIDDKWTFTRKYFQKMADELGASLKIYCLYESPSPFTGMLTQFLRDGFGRDKTALPDWAWELVDRWEKRVSLDALNDMLFAGGVIFTRPVTSAPRVG
jgi:SAM-dependent methyltransferase